MIQLVHFMTKSMDSNRYLPVGVYVGATGGGYKLEREVQSTHMVTVHITYCRFESRVVRWRGCRSSCRRC